MYTEKLNNQYSALREEIIQTITALAHSCAVANVGLTYHIETVDMKHESGYPQRIKINSINFDINTFFGKYDGGDDAVITFEQVPAVAIKV